MENSKLIRTIVFNILVILTIVFIYLFFFPKKSYVKNKIDNGLTSIVDDTFFENINSMKIAGNAYFGDATGVVSIDELIDNGLLVELKDSNGEACFSSSYVEKTDDKMKIHLDCSDKSGEKYINLTDKKFLCIYQYEKRTESGFTPWSDWSEWSTNFVEANDLVNVETEVRKESDGKTTSTETKQESISATVNTTYGCQNGSTPINGKCKILRFAENVSPRKGRCPTDTLSEEYVLEGNVCKKYSIYYVNQTSNTTYSCPSGYSLSGSTCYKSVSYDVENENFKDVTYYRYQKRERIDENIDIKWSTIDDQNLLNSSYTMVGKVSCEF